MGSTHSRSEITSADMQQLGFEYQYLYFVIRLLQMQHGDEVGYEAKDDVGIFQLWDFFFELILREGKHFQIIMLEHVSPSAWKECKHINLVAVFDGIYDALIPPVELTQKPE